MENEFRKYLEVRDGKVMLDKNAPKEVKKEYSKRFNKQEDIFNIIDTILDDGNKNKRGNI